MDPFNDQFVAQGLISNTGNVLQVAHEMECVLKHLLVGPIGLEDVPLGIAKGKSTSSVLDGSGEGGVVTGSVDTPGVHDNKVSLQKPNQVRINVTCSDVAIVGITIVDA